jgi:chromosome segregation ATPase
LRIIKHFWQNLVQRFKPRASASAGEFQHELSATREQQHSLLGQLTGLQAEVERGLSYAREEQQGLLGQLNDLRVEVKQDLSAAGVERQGLLGHISGLQAEYEREMSAARQEKQALLGQVSGLQDDLERISSRDEQLRDELQQRFDQLQAEREAANQELVVLRSSLAEANSRQELADTRVDSLEVRLREQQQEHDAALQQVLVRERRQARRLTAALMVAAAAFVLGIAGSVINFWEVRNTTRLLAEVSQGISQIRITMEGRSAGTTPAPSSLVAPAEPLDERASTGMPESLPHVPEGASQEPAATEQGLSGR